MRIGLVLALLAAPLFKVPATAEPARFEAPARDLSPGAGGVSAPLPEFPVDFRGSPSTSGATEIPHGRFTVRFYTETFVPGAGFVKEQVALNPLVHDIRVRYINAESGEPTEIRMTRFAKFDLKQMAGPGFSLIYKFPGEPAVTVPMKFTSGDIADGKVLGYNAYKLVDIQVKK